MNDKLTRWHFLTAPLTGLLAEFDAVIVQVPPNSPDDRFMGGIKYLRAGPLLLCMPAGQNPLERDGVARWLLATSYGIDTTDWPVPVNAIDQRFETETHA